MFKETRLFESGTLAIRFVEHANEGWSVEVCVGAKLIWNDFSADASVATATALAERYRDQIQKAQDASPGVSMVRLSHVVVTDYTNRDNKIAAIKAFRDAFGYGLREAKDIVEAAMERGVPMDTVTMERANESLALYCDKARLVRV